MTKTVFRVLGVVASVVVGGAASAADAPAVEWKVSDGGNGHWYQGISMPPNTWKVAQQKAIDLGGHLVTPTSALEQAFIETQILNDNRLYIYCCQGPYMGAFNNGDANGWQWVDGSPWNYTNWYPGNPNETPPTVVVYWDTRQWQDQNDTSSLYFSIGYVCEWDADCNGDGSVDYGQIQSGELADTNHNGVPDVCEPHVTYVQPISGSASGGTPVNINGMNFPTTVSVLFGGVAATDVVVVSSTLITAVTPVGIPGMTVVTVNGVGGEAFYYRSNCQSDLDGSGQVDSSDLGILLLDFGSCGEGAAVAPQQEPLILQSVEAPTPVLNKK